jgi:hypothetical protein
MVKRKVIGVAGLVLVALILVTVEFYGAKNAPGSGSTGIGEFWVIAIFTALWLIAAVARVLIKD